ncbi:major facilitator superfamily domain-containing protein [Rhodocollybia butyracea]|uniref:Major facilitator superfamily domain-containing protein n=1 Tax=Rhodocollybia butyracea TaxID=206335 RepID=A0A9P5U9L7_9AGAR|nr:major facilitator superfamily domain-containing protein [Rhodocollybia butyracea]
MLESETATKNEHAYETESKTPSPPSGVQLTDQTNLLPFKQVVTVFMALSLCVVVSALDSVIVATALSTVASAFHAGSIISWVPSAYLMTSTAFQPLYGRFSDIFGRKSAMCIAMSLYMAGNLIAGFSKSIIQIIVFRGVAGAGGGGIIGMMQIIISDIITLRERGKYQGIIGGVVAMGYTVGPVIGGVLAEKVGWKWCFWVTLPVALTATVVVVLVLPLKPVQGDMRKKLLVVDYLGAILTLVACTLIMLPLIWGGITFPWVSAIVLAPLCSGFLVVLIFCLWEWKGARLPIVPMYIFKHQTVSGVYISMFVNGFVFFSSLYYIPQFFQVALGYSPIHAGLFLIPLLIGQMSSSWIAGMTISRTGRYRAIVYSGFGVLAIACGCISTFKETTAKATMVVLMLLAGVGSGMTMQTTTVAVQAAVARKDMSVVTAFRNFIRMLGGAFSLSIASTLVNNAMKSTMLSLGLSSSAINSIVDDPTILARPGALSLSSESAALILTQGYTIGFRNLFFLDASLAVLATVVSFTMIKHKELLRGDEEKLKQEGLDALKARKAKHDLEKGGKNFGKDVEGHPQKLVEGEARE